LISRLLKFTDDDQFNLESLQKQAPNDIPVDPTKKTGLGSSAALIVSFIAATFKITGMIGDKDDVKHEVHMHA
jgi:mevalonate kinase